ERGQVAGADEWLGAFGDQIQIQPFEQIVRAVAAARGEDGADLIVGKGMMQIAEPHLGRSRKIMRSAGEKVLGGARRVAERTQGLKSALHSLRLRRGRR